MYRGVPFQILKDEEISRQIALAAYYGKEAILLAGEEENADE